MMLMLLLLSLWLLLLLPCYKAEGKNPKTPDAHRGMPSPTPGKCPSATPFKNHRFPSARGVPDRISLGDGHSFKMGTWRYNTKEPYRWQASEGDGSIIRSAC